MPSRAMVDLVVVVSGEGREDRPCWTAADHPGKGGSHLVVVRCLLFSDHHHVVGHDQPPVPARGAGGARPCRLRLVGRLTRREEARIGGTFGVLMLAVVMCALVRHQPHFGSEGDYLFAGELSSPPMASLPSSPSPGSRNGCSSKSLAARPCVVVDWLLALAFSSLSDTQAA